MSTQLMRDNKRQSLSKYEIKRNTKLTELAISTELTNRLKQTNRLTASAGKTISKKKKSKSKKVGSAKQKPMIPRCYSQCQSLHTLQRIAQQHAEDIRKLLTNKQQLTENNKKLVFYTANMLACREAYFVQQLEKKKIQIQHLEQALEKKSKSHKTQIKKLTKQAIKNSS